MMTRKALEKLATISSRCVYIGNNEALALVLGRIKMYLSTTDTGIFPHLALSGFWESWVTLAMMQMVKPGMHVVNIGANVGYYALLFAELVGPKGKVIAYEPNTDLVKLIEKSAELNGYRHLEVRPEAVSDACGRATFIVPKSRPMNAHLGDVSGAGGDEREVFMTTLDFPRSEAVPELIFIDAEGAEEGIWRGMSRARAASATIVMEYSPGRYKDPLAFAKSFFDDGYSLWFIHTDGSVKPTNSLALASGPEVMVVLKKRNL